MLSWRILMMGAQRVFIEHDMVGIREGRRIDQAYSS